MQETSIETIKFLLAIEQSNNDSAICEVAVGIGNIVVSEIQTEALEEV
jgi:hypothetical protein